MKGKAISSCHTETKANRWEPRHLGRRIYLQIYTDQRLQVECKKHRGIQQSSWWQGAHLRWHKQCFGWNRLPKSSLHRIQYYCIWQLSSETSIKLLYRDWEPLNLVWMPPAESRPLFSSSSLSLQNELRQRVVMYWTFIQTTMLMQTCSSQTVVKNHVFLVKPTYCLKPLYGVRRFCVCDVSVVQRICIINIFCRFTNKFPLTPIGCIFEVKLEDFGKDTTKVKNKQEYLLFYVVSMGFLPILTI